MNLVTWCTTRKRYKNLDKTRSRNLYQLRSTKSSCKNWIYTQLNVLNSLWAYVHGQHCWYTVMGKRKAEIFTVIDSVTSWAEASSHNPAYSGGDPEFTTQSSIGRRLEEQLQVVGPASTEANTGRPNPVRLQLVGEPADPSTADLSRSDVVDVAVGPSEPEAQVVGTLHTSKLEVAKGEVGQAFWNLLTDAGYEVWET